MRVKLKDNEPFERLLRRFKRGVEASGVLKELREKEFYTKPTTERKMKKNAAVRRHRKTVRSQQLPKRLY